MMTAKFPEQLLWILKRRGAIQQLKSLPTYSKFKKPANIWHMKNPSKVCTNYMKKKNQNTNVPIEDLWWWG